MDTYVRQNNIQYINKFWLDGDIRDVGAYAYARQNNREIKQKILFFSYNLK